MKRPNIRTTLASIFGLLAVSFAAFAALALSSLSKLDSNMDSIAGNWMPNVEIAKDLETRVADLRIAYRSHILRDDAEGKTAAEASIAKALSTIDEDVTRYLTTPTTADELGYLNNIKTGAHDYVEAGKEVLALSTAGKTKEANNILREKLIKRADAVVTNTQSLVEFVKKGSAEAYAAAQDAYQTTVIIASVVTALVLLVIGAAVWFALSQIASPISRITASMNGLAGGDADTMIPFAGRADEIGNMAAAVEVFRQNELTKRSLEQEAERQRSLSDRERLNREELDRERAAAMAQATSGLADGLKHLASGNLAFQLTDRFAEEFETLRSDFNQAVDQLRTTITSVAEATSTIDGGSREISRSADDLSKRTEQQAASLEETAAALDQITVNVANSSKRAEEARNVAILANQSATHSGQVVANAVDAMQKIEQSSNEISNIIGVIDEIAFQTNLLALNAGVEAARAGEAGKGFAVVAQEVRELAQRSAKAAKEIKELIRNSSAEVQNGVKLVSDTGTALRQIEGYIVTVNQHMDSIATSAREQSVGLGEVNTAVNQMDQVTQQNAAMVEETSAAGATLALEANRLKELVGQFECGGASAARPAVTASAHSTTALRKAPAKAAATSHPVPSPARSMVSRIASSFGAKASASAAPSSDSWEEF
ncbi:chemotaxis protein [Rhizobium sp. Leaf384]|uniref:HAMP domain-containing methyl-accepting chemotaxis protein n=1 Tax=Rhizobium sp. Leaf384 TaxID=1736358 RepID=UPI000712BB9F|nr:HAMP domain-containing methyl-accepting chemotaxis protein [Rhizobium sp. Leaf384]KQS77171.1 chemotaxis protein [Rhizobium sp. Leaf384]